MEIIKSKKIYLLEHILIKLFEEIKQIVNKLINKNLNKAIIIINNLPNELILILHRAALLAKIQIITFINLKKSIEFFLKNKNIIEENVVTLIDINKKIEVSIFEKNHIKRIFNSIVNKSDINFDNLPLKEEIYEINNKNKDYWYIKSIIINLTKKAYGIEENFEKIFFIENIESDYLNEISIFGALLSNYFPNSKESSLIFNFIDFEENYPLKELIIMENKYKINQKILEIFIDDYDIPFEDCFLKILRFFLMIIQKK